MAITARQVDASRYFNDPKLVTFANDIQNGRATRVAEAIKAGINPNAVGNDGFRPLFFIFPAKTVETAEVLLKAGADPNVHLPRGNTPLIFAVRQDNPDFTRVLLEAKADPNARGENNIPAIHEAVRSEQTEHLKLLAKAGADLNIVWANSTPLMAAVEGMEWAAATTLLELGADTKWRSQGGMTQYTAGESFCAFFTRKRPLVIPPSHHEPVKQLFAAFAKRGVTLPCADQMESILARKRVKR